MDEVRDNGIFDFMSPERAVELYQRIHSEGVPELEWKFYGRKNLNEPQEDDRLENSDDISKIEQLSADITQTTIMQTEFDFDVDSFADSSLENSTNINESLQLSTRAEPGSERKTNLSDIMSDLIKEKNTNDAEPAQD